MSRVLLISANREFMPCPVFPLGVAYVESALAQAGHETRVFDVNCHEADAAPVALAETVERFAPDVIGVSVRNIDNLTYPTSVSYMGEIRVLVESCRRAAPNAPIVLGGAGYSLFPVEAIEALGGDIGVVGEAEGRITRLVEALVGQVGNLSLELGHLRHGQVANLSYVGGLVYRAAEGFRQTRAATAAELAFPSEGPRRVGLDMEFYSREGGMANVQTKRGCPFHCSYCTYPLLEGRSFHVRPAVAVADEIERLAAEHGVEYLYFVDNYFNFPTDHAESVCRALIERRLAVPWSCFAHPAYLDSRLAALMRKAGCASVELGTDAGSPTMLAALRKEMTPEQILAASRACRDAGLPFAHYLLLGGPGETADTLSETFDLMDRCEPTAVIIMCGIRVYPGTAIERQAREEGWIAPGQSLLEPRFYLSPAVRSSLLERVSDEASRRPNWIVPGLEINVSVRLTKWLRQRGHKGPMWELLRQRKRKG
jgi:radical SAM superfamily enzyme YgiQ (UPF0313 family)